MGSKFNGKCPNKSEAEGDLTEGSSGGHVTGEAEIGVIKPQVQECQ